jgi:hypothetical protein
VDACYVGVGSSVALPTLAQVATPTPIAVGPLEYPYLSDISPRVSSSAGQARGNCPNVFAAVGDSNSQHRPSCRPFIKVTTTWGAKPISGPQWISSAGRSPTMPIHLAVAGRRLAHAPARGCFP